MRETSPDLSDGDRGVGLAGDGIVQGKQVLAAMGGAKETWIWAMGMGQLSPVDMLR